MALDYPSMPDQAAAEHLNLTVEEGKVLALVGPSGAGKTTLFELLQRFYDPQLGKVTLGGVDIRQFDPHELRKQMALVPQQLALFSHDVFHNIRYGNPPTSLELEITEGVLLDDPEGNRKTLEALTAMGVRLAIDDFGTGYSSLSYLRRFPFDTLKIDCSFIRDIPNETEAANLVSAIISIAGVLGLKTVAEGVENQE